MTATRVLALVALISAAQTAAAAPAEADQLYTEGVKLFDENRFPEACARFKRSHELNATVRVHGALALCYERAKQPALSLATWRAVLDETADCPAEARSHASAKVEWERLDALVPRLLIDSPPNASVTCDGAPIPAGETRLDPGPHVLRATAEGYETFEESVVLEPRARRRVAITLTAKPAPTRQRTAGLIVGSVGLVTIGGGVILGFLAKSAYDDANDNQCGGNLMCPLQSGVDAVNDAKDRATVATVVFGVGLAAVTTGVILYLTAPGEKAPGLAITPAISPDSVGLTVRGGF